MVDGRAERLRTIGDGDLGFCYALDPEVFWSPSARQQSDGPLVVALDTNVLIDLQSHGSVILEGHLPEGVSDVDEYGRNLSALGDLVELWLTRDIRFIPFQRALSDFRRNRSPELQQNRTTSLTRLAESLAFQMGDWEWDWAETTSVSDSSVIAPASIPGLADRELVSAAQTLGVDVFVTNDKRVLQGANYPDVLVNIWSTQQIVARLNEWGDEPFSGGHVRHSDCVYPISMPLGDTGKWVSLMELFDT